MLIGRVIWRLTEAVCAPSIRSQPGGRGRRARRLMCAVPAAPAGLRCGAGGVMAWGRGAGAGERGRGGVDVGFGNDDLADGVQPLAARRETVSHSARK